MFSWRSETGAGSKWEPEETASAKALRQEGASLVKRAKKLGSVRVHRGR